MIKTTLHNCAIRYCDKEALYKVETQVLLDSELLQNLKRGGIFTSDYGIKTTYACGSIQDKKSHISIIIQKWEKINRIRICSDFEAEKIRIVAVNPNASRNNSLNIETITEE